MNEVMTTTVSVPSRGAIFLNEIMTITYELDLSFRPLSGSYIS